MKKHLPFVLAIAILPFLSACVDRSQSEYTFDEVGQASVVEFGTVLKARSITIDKGATGVGTLVGGAAGAGAGSAVGGGHARIYAGIAGAAAGAAIGTVIEQGLRKDDGVEYTLATEKGKVISVAQFLKKGDPVFAPGERIMIQTSGSYQRVISASDIPTSIQRPQGVEMQK